ncbi:unnamed protein product [Sphagnum jensenii]|uniref:Uncharacterized protein n=1 Tax=Sphagnum jensenii TaxID=128206 RepID=A0ABP1A308_9BRYO
MAWESTVNVIVVSLVVGKIWHDINQRFKDMNQRIKDRNRIMAKTGVFGSELSDFVSTIRVGHPVNGPATSDDIVSSKMMRKVKAPQACHFGIRATKEPLPTGGVEPR